MIEMYLILVYVVLGLIFSLAFIISGDVEETYIDWIIACTILWPLYLSVYFLEKYIIYTQKIKRRKSKTRKKK